MATKRSGERQQNLAKDKVTRDGSVSDDRSARVPGLMLLALAVGVTIVFIRVFGAGFVDFDDDIHVYANPWINPPSLGGLTWLWQHAYKGLYIPLSYTIYAGLALFARAPAYATNTVGRVISLSPGVFHAASIGFHIVNVLLCCLLVSRLTRRRSVALICSLVFAVHPLQVESVAWVSELRGLSSATFALAALNVFVFSRQLSEQTSRRAYLLLAVSAVLGICSMLCKPATVVLSLAVLAIDRVALGTRWRKALATAVAVMAFVLPIAFVTRSVQEIHPEGMSLWWQRPFVAGDALAFYIYKAVAPVTLGIEYGRTPQSVLSHGLAYLIWVLPVALILGSFFLRRRRPMAWLGSLLFLVFLLPVLGFVPFAFQAHSTVADRYAYLPLVGIALVVADTAARSKLAIRAAGAIILVLGILSFRQTGYWADNTAFLWHTVDVNPNVAFAQNNLGSLLLKQKRFDQAIEHFRKALEIQPANALAENNLGLAFLRLGRLAEAEPHFRKAVEIAPQYFKAYESLGAIYLQTNRADEAIASLKKAIEIQPSEAKAFNDLGIAFMQSGRSAEGLEAFRHAVAVEPDNPQYRKNLGRALLQAGRADEAAEYVGQ